MIANDNPEQTTIPNQDKVSCRRKQQTAELPNQFWYEGMSPELKLAVQLSAAIRQTLTIGEQWKLAGDISSDMKYVLLDAIHFTIANIRKCNHKRLDDEFERFGVTKNGFVVLINELRGMCLGHKVPKGKALSLFKSEIDKYLPNCSS